MDSKKKDKSEVQSVLFRRGRFSKNNVVDFFAENDELIPIKKIHEVKNFYRVRLEDPKKYKKFRIKRIRDGDIMFIIGFK